MTSVHIFNLTTVNPKPLRDKPEWAWRWSKIDVFKTAIFQPKGLSLKHLNTVLHQLLKYIPRYRFDRAVERHGGDHQIRTLNCWTQFVALIYA
ncbi:MULTISPECIES: DUF4372 domain-containing protein [Nitrosomonas]|uniref:Uncharacterized protein DUF4372 n=1 Tax=Nitrosomonas communis TaxID=44574 RepID=A0A5D3Y7M5_9PROT|nr:MULTISPECIES: DUF4372 domain-containing protein [Nitrosomonas]TYP78332.1 uncharacterized protein DUF4372 [Nitrosomonas communis]UVS60283.1 DUF4372 domain-containing protein [Nitrosomonas sp. PLL12]